MLVKKFEEYVKCLNESNDSFISILKNFKNKFRNIDYLERTKKEISKYRRFKDNVDLDYPNLGHCHKTIKEFVDIINDAKRKDDMIILDSFYNVKNGIIFNIYNVAFIDNYCATIYGFFNSNLNKSEFNMFAYKYNDGFELIKHDNSKIENSESIFNCLKKIGYN